MKRQPIHVVYGGAHLFKAGTMRKLGELARDSMSAYLSDTEEFAKVFRIENSEIAGKVYERIKLKLLNEAVEDYRVDFEDGFGYREDKEEDETAIDCAVETFKAMRTHSLPFIFGIRVKAYDGFLRDRSLRTLRLYLNELLVNLKGNLPENFLITLPKITSPEQLSDFSDKLDELENSFNLPQGILKFEIMVESARSIFDPLGRVALPYLISAGRGRIEAAHFGAFDYLAELGVIAGHQTLRHHSCDFARNVMKVSLEGSGVRLSDGATNIMPIAPHKGTGITREQKEDNRETIHNAWREHFNNVTHSLHSGFYQGWDLHPAQLIPRYAATYNFFLENLQESANRLRNFLEQAARSTTFSNIFDDAASGRGLLNFFNYAFNCRAVGEEEAEAAGLSSALLESESLKWGTQRKK